jgi:DNA-directed RNA polymerase sigma subunit (sigma70/sigma32)
MRRGVVVRNEVQPAVQPLLRKALADANILSAERERELLHRYHAEADTAAVDELVRSHMPIIFRVAGRSARGSGADINDLVQTATEGLLIAINRWSFDKSEVSGANNAAAIMAEREDGAADGDTAASTEAAPVVSRASRLATYAMWWMRILLTDKAIENRGLVVRAKNPRVRKALFGMSAAISALNLQLPLTASDVTRIANHMGLGESDIEEALIHSAGDVFLDEPVGDGSALRGDVMADSKACDESGVLARLAGTSRWEAVCLAMMGLPARERFILIARYLMPVKWKLDRLSATLQMSRERIRQLGDESLARLRDKAASESFRPVAGGAAAVQMLEQLVSRIEAASEATHSDAIAVFLAEQGIQVGPTRIVKRGGESAGMPRSRARVRPVNTAMIVSAA